MRFSIKTKSVEISGEPFGCQVILSDTEPQFDKNDENLLYLLKIK
jgi:hypothetical protein